MALFAAYNVGRLIIFLVSRFGGHLSSGDFDDEDTMLNWYNDYSGGDWGDG